MDTAAFYHKVKKAILESESSVFSRKLNSELSGYFDQVYLDDSQDDLQKMTRLTVVF